MHMLTDEVSCFPNSGGVGYKPKKEKRLPTQGEPVGKFIDPRTGAKIDTNTDEVI